MAEPSTYHIISQFEGIQRNLEFVMAHCEHIIFATLDILQEQFSSFLQTLFTTSLTVYFRWTQKTSVTSVAFSISNPWFSSELWNLLFLGGGLDLKRDSCGWKLLLARHLLITIMRMIMIIALAGGTWGYQRQGWQRGRWGIEGKPPLWSWSE